MTEMVAAVALATIAVGVVAVVAFLAGINVAIATEESATRVVGAGNSACLNDAADQHAELVDLYVGPKTVTCAVRETARAIGVYIRHDRKQYYRADNG